MTAAMLVVAIVLLLGVVALMGAMAVDEETVGRWALIVSALASIALSVLVIVLVASVP